MPNLLDYLDWRGDLSFSAVPFCEVDHLILSELAYADFRNVLPTVFSESVPLARVAELQREYRAEDTVETGVLLPGALRPFFYRAAESRRFGEILLTGFESDLDHESETQFAAFTARLGDGTVFVAYRGTDDTLVGWKEDFNMSFLPSIPAQRRAADYLARMAEVYPERIRVGGHSKGGNLAVYAAATVSSEVQRRILAVYNNDGPGFSRAFLDSEGYARIRDRVRTYLPQTSIVGMLLEHECASTVVRSSESGLFQHDGFSWEVLGDRFVRLEGVTDSSKLLDRTLKGWIADLDEAAREEFVETLYAILSSTRAETLSDIRADRNALPKILKGVTKEQRLVLQKTLRGLIYAGERVLREDRAEKRGARELRKAEEKSRELEEKQLRRTESEEAREEKRARKEEERAERREDREERRIIEEEDRRLRREERRMIEEEERRLRREEDRERKESERKKRAALMVAVRPIRFRVVTAVPRKERGTPTDSGENGEL